MECQPEKMSAEHRDVFRFNLASTEHSYFSYLTCSVTSNRNSQVDEDRGNLMEFEKKTHLMISPPPLYVGGK